MCVANFRAIHSIVKRYFSGGLTVWHWRTQNQQRGWKLLKFYIMHRFQHLWHMERKYSGCTDLSVSIDGYSPCWLPSNKVTCIDGSGRYVSVVPHEFCSGTLMRYWLVTSLWKFLLLSLAARKAIFRQLLVFIVKEGYVKGCVISLYDKICVMKGWMTLKNLLFLNEDSFVSLAQKEEWITTKHQYWPQFLKLERPFSHVCLFHSDPDLSPHTATFSPSCIHTNAGQSGHKLLFWSYVVQACGEKWATFTSTSTRGDHQRIIRLSGERKSRKQLCADVTEPQRRQTHWPHSTWCDSPTSLCSFLKHTRKNTFISI